MGSVRRAAMVGGPAAAGVLAGLAYALVVRPWHLSWGAAPAEVAQRWPGDELVPSPSTRAVRAITVDAPPQRIWPWIMQIGRDRGGFHSYTWLENLIGADIENVERLLPDLPDRQPGDTVWMGPEDRFGGQARMIVAKVIPEHAMVLVPPGALDRLQQDGRCPDGVWSFVLDPVARDMTRFLMLSLGPEAPRPARRLVDLLFREPAHFVMERRMMLTIKRLAEATPASR